MSYGRQKHSTLVKRRKAGELDADDYKESSRHYRNIKQNLAVNLDLRRILKAAPEDKRGELREFLLEGLAMSATFDDVSSSANRLSAMRERARRLKTFAARMRTLAKRAKDLTEGPDSILDVWVCPQNVDWCSIKAMEQCADRAAFQARAFGQYTRRNKHHSLRIHEVLLAERVRRDTGRAFGQELARLMTDAQEIAGQNQILSAETIQKHNKQRGKTPRLFPPHVDPSRKNPDIRLWKN